MHHNSHSRPLLKHVGNLVPSSFFGKPAHKYFDCKAESLLPTLKMAARRQMRRIKAPTPIAIIVVRPPKSLKGSAKIMLTDSSIHSPETTCTFARTVNTSRFSLKRGSRGSAFVWRADLGFTCFAQICVTHW